MKSNFRIETLIVGQMLENCFLLFDENTHEGYIIDPGDEGEYISKKIENLKIKPKGIIATHGHFDHIMAVCHLQLIYNLPFFIHKDDEFLVKNLKNSARHFLGIDAGPSPKISNRLNNGDKLPIGNSFLKILETPGHTPGSVSLIFPDLNAVFSGDLIFENGGVGRTDFSYSDSRKMEKSLNKIHRMKNNTIFYPGHGNVFNIASGTIC